jgi:drug/metabolite transporter (DMT)-like permease
MTASPASRPGALAWTLLIVLGFLWGGSFFLSRIAVLEIPPLTLAFLRLAIAALALHIYLRGRYDLYRTLVDRYREFILMGFINNALPHTLIFFGQTEIGAGLASILNATTPIWTVIIANHWTADEKLSAAKLAGCLTGLLGTAILIGPSLSSSASIPLWALILPIGAAISYGFAATYGKRFRGLAAPVTATGQVTASSLMLLPAAILYDQPWTLPMPSTEAIVSVVVLALLCTAFAYLLFFRVLALAGAINASLVTLLVPPSAILLGALFLHERLGWTDLAGMAVIAFGLLVLDGRMFAARRRAP